MTSHRFPVGVGLIALGLLLLGAGVAGAEAAPPNTLARHRIQVTPGRWVEVRGERNHQRRTQGRLPATWSADQKASAAAYGFPIFRLRELSGGVQTEVWTYPDADVQLVFDASGRLITTRLP